MNGVPCIGSSLQQGSENSAAVCGLGGRLSIDELCNAISAVDHRSRWGVMAARIVEHQKLAGE